MLILTDRPGSGLTHMTIRRTTLKISLGHTGKRPVRYTTAGR
jgi:hypothetical protein